MGEKSRRKQMYVGVLDRMSLKHPISQTSVSSEENESVNELLIAQDVNWESMLKRRAFFLLCSL